MTMHKTRIVAALAALPFGLDGETSTTSAM
jgi:hypothetical protein